MDLIQKACNLGFILKNKEYYLWELQKWLREEHGIIVLADYGFIDDSTDAYCWSITTLNTESKSDFDRLITIHSLSDQFRDWYETYEEALESGLMKALEMIK